MVAEVESRGSWPAIRLSNYTYDKAVQVPNPLIKAYFGNAILYGASDEELGLDSVAGTQFNYKFENTILKTGIKTGNSSRYVNCLINKNPRFKEVIKWDYRIDSISPAIDKGLDLGIPKDIVGNDRTGLPDLGAYEYVKKN